MTSCCTCGLYRLAWQGMNDLVRRDISLWTGELSVPGVTVFLHSRIAYYASPPLAFLITFFMILTAASKRPLDWLWWELLVIFRKSHDLAKSANSRDASLGPLSLIRATGMPRVANSCLVLLMRVNKTKQVSEITDEVSFGRRDQHLHLRPQMKQVW